MNINAFQVILTDFQLILTDFQLILTDFQVILIDLIPKIKHAVASCAPSPPYFQFERLASVFFGDDDVRLMKEKQTSVDVLGCMAQGGSLLQAPVPSHEQGCASTRVFPSSNRYPAWVPQAPH